MNRPQFHRICVIHERIRAGGYPNARTLAEDIEVSERTILRDLDHLRDLCRAPLAYDGRRRGFYYTEPSFSLPGLQITEGELLAVVLSLSLMEAHGGTSLDQAVRSVAAKLPHLLPDHVSVELDGLARSISFAVEPLRGEQERVAAIFELFSQAIRDRRRVEMRYFTASRGERTVRRVDPYHLRYVDGAWYLFAHCHMRDEVRVFALDRVEEARLLKERFIPAEDFSVEALLHGAWRLEMGKAAHRVVIRFAPAAAVYVRGKRWHPTQEITEHPDGSLTFVVTVTGPGEVLRWVKQFVPHAELLEPAELREELAADLAEAAGPYAVVYPLPGAEGA